MKKNVSIYAYPDSEPNYFLKCNFCSDKLGLIVNCSGNVSKPFNFTTFNRTGRLDYYLMYIVEGQMQFVFDGKPQVLGAGSAIIFPPKYPYHYRCVSEDSLCYLWVHFTGSAVGHVLQSYSLSPLTVLDVSYDGETIALFEDIWRILEKKDAFFEQAAALRLESIMLRIAQKQLVSPPPPTKLTASLNFINSNYSEKITLDQLAALENLSVSRYSTLFKSIYGISPIKYLTNVRIKTACELLATTDMPISEISFNVGYPDPQFFSKHFKKTTTLSPRGFRNKS